MRKKTRIEYKQQWIYLSKYLLILLLLNVFVEMDRKQNWPEIISIFCQSVTLLLLLYCIIIADLHDDLAITSNQIYIQ